jgi:hypothetical protein
MREHAMGALKTTLKVIGYHTPPSDHAALRPPWSGRGSRKKPKKIKTRNGKTDRRKNGRQERVPLRKCRRV